LCNLAAAQARGTVLAFVDASCAPADPSWLSRLCAYALRKNNGLAGAKLVSEQGRIAGGAVLLGVRGRFALLYKGLDAGEVGYFARAAMPQEITALDAGCVVVARDRFEACGAFDPQYCSLQAATIDLSLRLGRHGLRNTWVPAVLMQQRTAQGWRRWREQRHADRDWRLLRATWPECSQPDPAYNPNLTIARETFGLAQPPRVGLERPWFDSVQTRGG
jgi:GT2 family glycosyltransferase